MSIENSRRAVPAVGPWAPWFPAGRPGLGALPEHAGRTGNGTWWADHPFEPWAAAVSCGGYTVLAGDPRATDPADLAPLAHTYVVAPDRFLPVLGAAFEQIIPWERMIWVHRDPAPAVPRAPRPTVRRLTPRDTPAVRALGPDLAWLGASWGGPAGLTASGRGWGAFREGRLLSLACVHFSGSRYEDIAVATLPTERGRGLATACVRALCADITARGSAPSWTCSRDNHPSRGLAAKTGFHLIHEYVHYAVGAPSALQPRSQVAAAP
ncbi:GNAT family N-acetyltransferase [Streptomyces sp. NPDC051162]|uniref:GNAT family N-acetyltransferase n=1 Tax=Streptomyces sp. NPDC051162 TaxID=3154747 RepID=UPI003416D12C